MIGLQWRPGKQQRKPQSAPVVISAGPSTPRTERAAPPFNPFLAYEGMAPVKPKRGRPRKNR